MLVISFCCIKLSYSLSIIIKFVWLPLTYCSVFYLYMICWFCAFELWPLTADFQRVAFHMSNTAAMFEVHSYEAFCGQLRLVIAYDLVWPLMHWLHVKYNYFEIISAFVDVRLKYFYFSASKLEWNYFKIISRDYCSSWILSNMSNVAEIIWK